MISDLRQVVGGLRRRPRFTSLVVLTTALGIGPTLVVFGMVNRVLLRPLPGIPNSDAAAHVQIWIEGRAGGLSQPDYERLRDRSRDALRIATYHNLSLRVTTGDGAVRLVAAHAVNGDFFEVLGAVPSAGRLLEADETGFRSDPFVAVISERLRDDVFGPDADPTGESLRIGQDAFRVVGVVAGGFRGPLASRPRDMWLPLSATEPLIGWTPELLGDPSIAINTRFVALPGRAVEAERLIGDIERTLRQLDEETVGGGRDVSTRQVRVYPGLQVPPGSRADADRMLSLMWWSALLIIVIACSNVTNLMLFRSLSTRGAIATRRVLGASPARIAYQHLLEATLLGGLGAVCALVLAEVVFFPFRGWALQGTQSVERLFSGSSMLLVAGLVGVVAALIAGALPALLSGRFDLSGALRGGQGRETGRLGWLRTGLAAGQLGLTLALATGGVLMIGTLMKLRALDTGLEVDGVVRMWLDPESVPLEEAPARFETLLTSVGSLGGVTAVAFDEYGPHSSRRTGRVVAAGDPGEDAPSSSVWQVSPGWFELFGVQPLHGRVFDSSEWRYERSAPVAVLTRSLATRLFGTTDAVGRSVVDLSNGDPVQRRVVGVVPDYRSITAPDAAMDAMFVHYGVLAPSQLTLLVRSTDHSGTFVDELRAVVGQVLPGQPIPDPVSIVDDVANVLEDQRRLGILLVLLAALGALMSGAGLYSVVYHLVSTRTKEFGIRLALGAERRAVVRLLMRFVASVWTTGLAVGLVGAWWLSRLLESQLFGIQPMDPVAVVIAGAYLGFVCVVASWVPARAAMRVQPFEALRLE